VSSLMFFVFCVGRSFYDELISRPWEPYRVCVCVCPIACDLETSTHRRPKHDLGFDTRKKNYLLNYRYVEETYIINSGNKASRNKDSLGKGNCRRGYNISVALRQRILKKKLWSGFIWYRVRTLAVFVCTLLKVQVS